LYVYCNHYTVTIDSPAEEGTFWVNLAILRSLCFSILYGLYSKSSAGSLSGLRNLGILVFILAIHCDKLKACKVRKQSHKDTAF